MDEEYQRGVDLRFQGRAGAELTATCSSTRGNLRSWGDVVVLERERRQGCGPHAVTVPASLSMGVWPPHGSDDSELAGGCCGLHAVPATVSSPVGVQPPRYSGDGELIQWGCQRAGLTEKEHNEEDCRDVEHDVVLPIKF